MSGTFWRDTALASLATYNRAMGRIGYLSQYPELASPAELERLTDTLLTGGRRPRKNQGWYTARQLRSREAEASPLGQHVERAARRSASWLPQLPPLRKNQPLKDA